MLKKSLVMSLLLLGFLLVSGCGGDKTVKKDEAPSASSGTPVLISNFEDNKTTTAFGGDWSVLNDAANNGDSTALPDPFALEKTDKGGAKGSSYFAKLTGKVTTKFQYGFIGIGCNFLPGNAAMDLNKYTGVKFFTRGDGKSYKIQIKTGNITDYCYFTYTIPTTSEWTEITIPFRSFQQESWGQKKLLKDSLTSAFGLQWETIGQPIASIDLELDEVSFF